MQFLKATTAEEREAIDLFLLRHNQRGFGSTRGYIAYYAALSDGKMVAAAKFCPLHTPQAAKFFAGDDWRQVYCLQRLAAAHYPGQLSQFVGWCLREIGKDPKVWYVATYADTRTIDPQGRPHNGGIYRATNAVYCGMTAGNRVEAYLVDGQRHSLRKGPKTMKVGDIPAVAKIIRNRPQHRYCWPVGPTLKKGYRLAKLAQRMSKFKFEAVYQLLIRRLLIGI